MNIDPKYIVESLNNLRVMPVSYEFQIYEDIEKILVERSIPYNREVKIGKNSRIDFLCDRVGIEVKKGKPNRKKVERQVSRYCGSAMIDSLILIVERSLFGHLNEVRGKKVYYIALNKLWGLSV